MAQRWAMGTKLQRLNPVSGAYDDIPNLGDITGPGQNVDVLDITTHSSPNSYEEKIPTVIRSGTIGATMGFDPSNAVHLALLGDLQAKSERTWHLVMTDPSNTTLSFNGYVTNLSYSFPVTGKNTQNFEVTISGAITKL